MAMVGTHRDGYATFLLQFKECFHHMEHINVSFQVVGFVEVTLFVALCTTQVNKVDAVGKTRVAKNRQAARK